MSSQNTRRSSDRFPSPRDRRRGQLALAEWGEGRAPLPLTMMAQQSATSSEEVYLLISGSSWTSQLPGFEDTKKLSPDWLGLYHRHRRIEDVLKEVFQADSFDAEGHGLLKNLIDAYHGTFRRAAKEEFVANLPANPVDFLIKSEDYARDLYSEHIETLRSEIVCQSTAHSPRIEDLDRPECIFFLRVWIPCFLIYGVHPSFMYRKA